MDSIVLLLVMGLCTSINFVVIIHKYRKERYADATLDFILLGIIGWMFSSGINALCIGMFASAFISTYLWFRPIYIFKDEEEEEEYEYE